MKFFSGSVEKWNPTILNKVKYLSESVEKTTSFSYTIVPMCFGMRRFKLENKSEDLPL